MRNDKYIMIVPGPSTEKQSLCFLTQFIFSLIPADINEIKETTLKQLNLLSYGMSQFIKINF